MEIRGDSWGFVEIRGDSWRFVEIRGTFVEIRGTFVEIRGPYICVVFNIRGDSWGFVGFRGVSWCFVGAHFRNRGSCALQNSTQIFHENKFPSKVVDPGCPRSFCAVSV